MNWQSKAENSKQTYELLRLIRTCLSSRLHVIFPLFLIKFSFLFRGRILVLLILGNKVVHVTLSFSELHLIHTLARVPVKESLPAEHGGEILRHTLEHFLNRGAVPPM